MNTKNGLRLVRSSHVTLKRRLLLRLKMLSSQPQRTLDAIWPLIEAELGGVAVHK